MPFPGETSTTLIRLWEAAGKGRTGKKEAHTWWEKAAGSPAEREVARGVRQLEPKVPRDHAMKGKVPGTD